MNIKYLGEQTISYLISKCKATFASIAHTHTALEIGADASGSASKALSNAKTYTDEQIEIVSGNLSTHTGNNIIHITSAERTKWNSKADQTAIDTVLSDAKEYVDEKIDAIVGEGASTTLDTIGEISAAIETHQDVTDALNAAIGNKANSSDLTSHTSNKSNPHEVTKSQVGLENVENKSSATIRSEITKSNVTTALGYTPYTQTEVDELLDGKVDKVSGKGLSTNDYTTTEKTKLNGIAEGAQVNQDAFSNVKVGNITVSADTTTDTLEIEAGTGISVTGDATNDKVTITNSGVRSISIGSTNGTISVNTGGTSDDVAVKGLGSAAYTASTDYAKSSHGTHVTWSTTSPKMNGTAAVGTETKVARGDHVHPIDTSRASQADLDALEEIVENHEHNYAGSNEPSGAANSANKINTNAGSATQPVYFSGGIPVACTNTLGKSVPSDAVFTDAKVTQTVRTTDGEFPILLRGTSAGTSTTTTGTTFGTKMTANPSTGAMTITSLNLGGSTISYDETEGAIVFNFL